MQQLTSLSLTTLLLLAGGVVLLGVLVHGLWSARRAGPRRATEDGIESRLEPQLDPVEAAALEPDVLAPDAPVAAVARPPRRPSVRIDALIDAIAVFTLEAPVSGEFALQHQPPSHRAGNKPFQIEGLNAETGDWELPQPGQRYSEFQAGLKMANRAGPVNEIEYSEFVQKLQAFADAIQADAQFPDMLEVVAHARELDQFAAAHDAQLALLLRAKSTAWTPGFIHQMALRHGFVPGQLPGRLVLPSPDEGAPPILTLNFDPQAALAENPEAQSLRELTLALDVPQTPAEQEPFAAWQDSARLLARDLEAEMCDDRGHPLGLHAFAAIDTELKKLYETLAARDLPAGSAAARRLFS